LISETWKPSPENGVTVFLQGLEKRGPDNRRKRIYMSAVTPDLYRAMYGDKVMGFFNKLLDSGNAGKPLMRLYLEAYFDLYWDLHLGVKGEAIPARVRQIGESFNTVLAYRDPTQKIVYDNYMVVRANLSFLKAWIDERLADLTNGKAADPEKTFAWYWIKNAGDGENFQHKDVGLECFHNFVAFISASGATRSTTSRSSWPRTLATLTPGRLSRRRWKAISIRRAESHSRPSSVW
jgi:hypothetical protein